MLNIFLLFISFLIQIAYGNTLNLQLNTNVAHIDGPNCWNQALISVSLLKTQRFTSDEEFVYLLENHCTEIKNPIYGSLGRMSDKEGEVHAFIWLSEDQVYAKHSMGAFEKPSIMPTELMLEEYLIHEECIPMSKIPQCIRRIRYYECNKIKSPIEAQQNQLASIESVLHSILFGMDSIVKPNSNCDSEHLKSRFLKLNEFITLLEKFRNEEKIIEASYFKTWIISMTEQLDEIELSTSSEICLNTNADFKNDFKLFNKAKRILKNIKI